MAKFAIPAQEFPKNSGKSKIAVILRADRGKLI